MKTPTAHPRTTLATARHRLVEAQAERTEMQNRTRKGELITVAEVEAVWREILSTVRARLLALPTSLAPELAQETAPRVVFNRLTAAITDALRELAAWRPPKRTAAARASSAPGVRSFGDRASRFRVPTGPRGEGRGG